MDPLLTLGGKGNVIRFYSKMKSPYIHFIQQHTIIKFLIAFAISAVLYAMSSFLFPILLAIGLAFALYPLSRAFVRLQLGKTGMHPSRVVAIILAFIASAIFGLIVISFVVLPLFEQLNELLAKLPEYSKQMEGESLLRILKEPVAEGAPVLPSSLEGLLEDAINAVMGFLANVARNLLNSTVQMVANLVAVPGFLFPERLAAALHDDYGPVHAGCPSQGQPCTGPDRRGHQRLCGRPVDHEYAFGAVRDHCTVDFGCSVSVGLWPYRFAGRNHSGYRTDDFRYPCDFRCLYFHDAGYGIVRRCFLYYLLHHRQSDVAAYRNGEKD